VPFVNDGGVEGDEIRASDSERQAVVDRLSTACADGQLTLDEFSERTADAWAAITRGQLEDVTRDLRLPVSASRPASSSTDSTDEPKKRRRWIVAIMGGEDQRGRWRAERELGAVAMMGGVLIDLRDATLEADEVDITAWAIMGGVHVIVPEGIPVEFTGMMLMGGRSNRTSRVEPLPGAPKIRIRGYGMWGTIVVQSKPPRQPGEPDDDDDQHGHHQNQNWNQNWNQNRNQNQNRNRDRSQRHGTPPHWLPTPPPPAPPPVVDPGGLVTVVCTDIVGSTRIADSLGDQRWRAVLQAHYTLARHEVAQHGGTEVKTRGDGLLLTFNSPRRAVQFAVAFQTALEKERASDPDFSLEARVGVHAGEVERDGLDVVGRNVSLACRLCDAAAPGEILTSSVVADLADSASDLAFGAPRELMLPGIERAVFARPATSRD
jgi:class 3 adenylate cyclase